MSRANVLTVFVEKEEGDNITIGWATVVMQEEIPATDTTMGTPETLHMDTFKQGTEDISKEHFQVQFETLCLRIFSPASQVRAGEKMWTSLDAILESIGRNFHLNT